ncbi:MAG: hypothetical protein QOE33_593 [Acidobacteriota bacterium]|nr:hypothetical protein [Acidobacteriota bacterium]
MKSHTLLSGPLSLMLLCAASSGAAQGPVHDGVTTTQPFETMVTTEPSSDEKRDVTGEIARVDPADNTVVVKDSKTGRHLSFHLAKGTRLKADRQTELAGRKRLALADFKAGHLVKLTYRASDGKPLEMRLRANKT